MHNLAAAAVKLLERAAAAPAGRAALILVPGAGAPLKQTLLALQVLHGRVRLVTSEERWELGQGDTCSSRPAGTGWRAWRTPPCS